MAADNSENQMLKSKSEDQVAEDIEEAKTLLQKVFANLKRASAPIIGKGKKSTGALLTSTQGLVDKSFLKKLIRVFFIIFFLLILVFIGSRLIQTLQQNGVEEQGDGQAPTTAPFSPFRPSVYADDPDVLSLEQDINVLEREISRVILREDSLFPPSLDFKINFKE